MNEIESTIEVAKGISDYGFMVVVCAVFLFLSAMLMTACFKWFKSIIDDMIKGNQEMVAELLAETKTQNDMLTDIAEGLRPETQLRIKNISGIYFDLAVERVCRIIRKIREENHIADHDATSDKIHTLIENLHEDRNSRFDCFTYRGKKLSLYCNNEWVEWVEKCVWNEVYFETVNNGRTYTNVEAVYSKIKLDFYHRLTE